MKLYLYVLLLISAVCFTQCDELAESGIVAKNPEGDSSLRSPDWYEVNQTFSLDMFQRMIENEESENVIISPLSIELALSMLSNGAADETLAGIEQTLAQQGVDRSIANMHFLNLMNDYNNRSNIELSVANSIWVDEGFPVKPSFLEVNETFYDATVESLDLQAGGAADQINSWVSDKTENRIEEIINDIPANAVMYLINAIYFKGQWFNMFDSVATAPAPFILGNGNEVQRDFMMKSDPLATISTDQFDACSLPFKDSTFGMSFFIPKSGIALEDWISTITVEDWQTWNDRLQFVTENVAGSNVSVFIPKFTIEYEALLNPYLQAMGMEEAFTTGAANFSNMTEMPVEVSEVKHKTFFEIDESGAEAAAVTSIGVVLTGGLPVTREIRLDRPFMIVLHDYTTGNIMFVGKIGNPKQS